MLEKCPISQRAVLNFHKITLFFSLLGRFARLRRRHRNLRVQSSVCVCARLRKAFSCAKRRRPANYLAGDRSSHLQEGETRASTLMARLKCGECNSHFANRQTICIVLWFGCLWLLLTSAVEVREMLSCQLILFIAISGNSHCGLWTLGQIFTSYYVIYTLKHTISKPRRFCKKSCNSNNWSETELFKCWLVQMCGYSSCFFKLLKIYQFGQSLFLFS